MTHPLIAAALAMPKTHEVVTRYADGTEKAHQTRSLASAKTHADYVVAPRVGRDLIDRDTNRAVRIVGYSIREIAK